MSMARLPEMKGRHLRQHRQHRRPPAVVVASDGDAACADPAPLSPMLLTVLTVLTVFSSVAHILMILLPARPSLLKVMSMPTRKNVCARRSRPANARGLFGPSK